MRDPFKIEPPFLVSLSGGRTSAYMLRKILDAYSDKMPDESAVVFANTGKERVQTLDFVRKIESEWNVSIAWLEYQREKPKFRTVHYETAARAGEPFEALLADKRRLPSTLSRFCTNELKVQTIRRWARSIGFESDAIMAIGLRYDEPHRVARLRGRDELPFDYQFPMFDARVTATQVREFWSRNTFDLNLPVEAMFSNCDLCFLKRTTSLVESIRLEPDRAEWWIAQERKYDQKFRLDRPSYASLLTKIRIQPELFKEDDEGDLVACHCTD